MNFKTQRANEGNLPRHQERLSATESFTLAVKNQRKGTSGDMRGKDKTNEGIGT